MVSRTPALLLAVLGPLAVAALMTTVRGVVTGSNAALVLVLVVVAVAATGHRAAGVLAALVAAASFDYFLAPPYYTFAFLAKDDIVTAVLLTLIGLGVTELALWGRRQQNRAGARAGYLAGVVSTARLAASAELPQAGLVELVARQIADVLQLDACRFDPAPASRRDRPRLLPDGTITWRGHLVDVDHDGLPTLDEIELPVTAGRFLLTSTSAIRRPDLEQRQVAVTLAEQVS
jgi:K+-sensing histidine kinase KdpD